MVFSNIFSRGFGTLFPPLIGRIRSEMAIRAYLICLQKYTRIVRDKFIVGKAKKSRLFYKFSRIRTGTPQSRVQERWSLDRNFLGRPAPLTVSVVDIVRELLFQIINTNKKDSVESCSFSWPIETKTEKERNVRKVEDRRPRRLQVLNDASVCGKPRSKYIIA